MAVDRPGRSDDGRESAQGRADRVDENRAVVDAPGPGRPEWRDPRDLLSPEDRARSYNRVHRTLTEAELKELEADNIERYGRAYDWDPTWDGPTDPEPLDDTGNVNDARDGTDEASDASGGGNDEAEVDPGLEVSPLERADRPHDGTQPRIEVDYYSTVPPSVGERYAIRDQSNPVPVFKGPPTREQAAQGSIGDCGIVTTLGAVAGHRSKAVRDAIAQTGEGRYEVRIHEITRSTSADPVARPTGDTITYRINDVIPVATDRSHRPPVGVKADICGWPSLLEKTIATQDQTWDRKQWAEWDRAWLANKPVVDAERRGKGLPPSPRAAPTGYNRLDIGSTAYQRADLLAELTGEEAEVRTMPGEQQGEQALLDEFRDRLAAGKPILVGTRAQLPGEKWPLSRNVFAFGHAYEVIKVENDKIHLRNPWGTDELGNSTDPPPMDVKTFWEYYRRYNADGSRTGLYSTLR